MERTEHALRLLGTVLVIWALLASALTLWMVRTLPRGSRLKALPTVFLQTLFGVFPRPRWTWSRADRDATKVRVLGHLVGWSQLERRDDLVRDRQCITTEGSEAETLALDLDGTALVSQRLPLDDGYRLYLRARDDSMTEVVRGGPHDTGWATGGSIDRGAVAWVRWDRKAGLLELWRWDATQGARVIHQVDVPARTRRGAPNGWAVVLGDFTVATLLHDVVGRVVVHDPEHGVVDIAATRLPTLHRDLAFEERGKRVVAFNMHVGGPVPDRVASLDLDVWPPTVTDLGAGYQVGASTVLGEVLGGWAQHPQPVLDIPVDQGIIFSAGIVVDPIGDNSWVALILAAPEGVARPRVPKQALLTDGTRCQILSGSAHGKVLLRGEFICWQEAEPRAVPDPGTPHPGTTSWVARLNPYKEPEPPAEPSSESTPSSTPE